MRSAVITMLPLIFMGACTGADGARGPKGDPGSPADGGAPAISAIVPPTALLERDVDVVISGAQTGFDATATVDFGPGITVSSTTVVSGAELRCSIHVETGAALGPRDVKVTSGGTVLVATQGFEVRPSLGVWFVSPSTPADAPLLQGDLLLLDVASLDDQPLGSQASSTVTSDDGLYLLPNIADGTPNIWTAVDIPAPFDPTSVVFDARSKLYAITTSQLGILSLTASGGAMSLHPLAALWGRSASSPASARWQRGSAAQPRAPLRRSS